MAQRARRAGHGDCIGSGLSALPLASASTTAASIASSSPTRGKQQRQQKQSEQRGRQGKLCTLSNAYSAS
jgi:C-terminal processing protease CtpA/Prc